MGAALLFTPFMETTTGILLPVGVPGCTITLIWYTPTKLTIPLKTTCAGTPPIVTVGVVTVLVYPGAALIMPPLGMAGLTAPSPVVRTTRVCGSLILAGWQV